LIALPLRLLGLHHVKQSAPAHLADPLLGQRSLVWGLLLSLHGRDLRSDHALAQGLAEALRLRQEAILDLGDRLQIDTRPVAAAVYPLFAAFQAWAASTTSGRCPYSQ